MVLRPGSVTKEMLNPIIGEIADPLFAGQAQSPGTSPRHYAARTRTELIDTANIDRRLQSCPDPIVVLSFDAERVPPPHVAIVMPSEAKEYGAKLYESLRQADSLDRTLILIERPTERGGVWEAIQDRLRRATS
jgi:hypothetical protein